MRKLAGHAARANGPTAQSLERRGTDDLRPEDGLDGGATKPGAGAAFATSDDGWNGDRSDGTRTEQASADRRRRRARWPGNCGPECQR